MNYTLTVTPKQLAVIQTALEDYFRTRMGQYFDLSSDLAGVFLPDVDEIDMWDKCARRDAAQRLMEGAYRICQPPDKGYRAKTDDMMIAEDIWAVIRHERWLDKPEDQRKDWTTDSDKPLHIGPEPLVTIGRVEDGE